MIYFLGALRARRLVAKIGYSSGGLCGCRKRFKSLAITSPVPVRWLGVMDGDAAFDLELRKRFAELRLNGEWYRCEGQLRSFISKHAEQRAEPPMPLPIQWGGRYIGRRLDAGPDDAVVIGIARAGMGQLPPNVVALNCLTGIVWVERESLAKAPSNWAELPPELLQAVGPGFAKLANLGNIG